MVKKSKNFSSRILLIVIASFALTSFYYVINMYQYKISTAEQNALSQLQIISRTVAAQVNGTIVKMLLSKYENKDDIIDKYGDPDYREIVETLDRAAKLNNLKSDLYTLSYDSTSKSFFFGMTSAEKQYFRHNYKDPPAELIAGYETGGIVPAYEDEHGTWLSAFTPIKDANGQVVAVIQADLPFDAFIEEARSSLFMNILYSLILITVVGVLLFYWLRTLLVREERMMQQLEITNDLIHRKNEDITASINYAQRIQSSLMDSENKLKSLFSSCFVLYEPKDILSGDFYWIQSLSEDDSRVAVAAADCTGHGVPGALVSVLGITFLRDIVNNRPTIRPHEILMELNRRIIDTFKQKGKGLSSKDGMDISICIIDKKKQTIGFSGAYRPLLILRGKELTEISGDKKPIGGDHFDEERLFTSHDVDYQPGDWIYMFSDGYVDQFGGDKLKKFMKKRLKSMITDFCELKCHEQYDILHKELMEWKGETDQVDDITVMGIGL